MKPECATCSHIWSRTDGVHIPQKHINHYLVFFYLSGIIWVIVVVVGISIDRRDFRFVYWFWHRKNPRYFFAFDRFSQNNQNLIVSVLNIDWSDASWIFVYTFNLWLNNFVLRALVWFNFSVHLEISTMITITLLVSFIGMCFAGDYMEVKRKQIFCLLFCMLSLGVYYSFEESSVVWVRISTFHHLESHK